MKIIRNLRISFGNSFEPISKRYLAAINKMNLSQLCALYPSKTYINKKDKPYYMHIHIYPTCQTESKDGEKNQDVEGYYGVLDS